MVSNFYFYKKTIYIFLTKLTKTKTKMTIIIILLLLLYYYYYYIDLQVYPFNLFKIINQVNIYAIINLPLLKIGKGKKGK